MEGEVETSAVGERLEIPRNVISMAVRLPSAVQVALEAAVVAAIVTARAESALVVRVGAEAKVSSQA